MVSEEKIGFVIGLLFIIAVAFALNGMPRFGETTASSELTTAMVSRPVGIRPKLQPEFFSPEPIQEQPAPEASPPPQDRPDAQETPQDEPYVVRKGDTLWRIAAKQLGDGRRYKEIVELNSGVISNENSLAVGTRLTLPAR
jgi:Tfp pilus assembly protein FimV